MKFAQETDYALRLVYAFSRMPPGDSATAADVSESERIPYRFLLRILGKLKRAGIVASRRGVEGGYHLARPGAAITMREVIEAVEGPIRINRCLKNISFCNASRAPDCRVHQTLAAIQERLFQELESYNFDNLEGGPPAKHP